MNTVALPVVQLKVGKIYVCILVMIYDLVDFGLEPCTLLIFLMLFGVGISYKKIFNTGSLMQRPGTSL